MKEFLHVNITIEVGSVGWIVTLPAVVIVNILRIGMTLGGAMAGLTLDIFESRASVLGRAGTGGAARQAGRVGGLSFLISLSPFRREDKLLWGLGLGASGELHLFILPSRRPMNRLESLM
jgi:hypothetical protein